jgi:hypothetical protein
MFVAGFLAALTIFAAFLARVVSRDPAMGYAVFAAMAATVLLDTLEPGPYVWLMGSSASFLADLPAVLLNPGAGLSPFFITPRGQFSLLVCLVFLARWRGRFDLAYLLLACLAFLHQSQAALHCGALVAIDLICRPGVLVTSRVWPSLALAAVLFVTRDAVIDSVFAVDPKISVLAMLAVFAFAAYWGSTTARRAVDRLAVALWRRLAWLRRREIVVADALCIMTLWLMMIPAILIIEDTLFPVRSAVYFWGQVNTRLWAAYRTVVLMALFWLLFRRLLSLYGDRFLWPASAAAAVAVLAMFIVFQPQQALLRAQPALVESARHYERTLEEARRRPQAAPFPYRETVLYYALVKSVETQQDWLSALSQRHDPRLRDRGLKPLPPVSD